MEPTIFQAGSVVSMPMGVTCAVHKHDEYVPIEVHHIWPIGMGGPDTVENKIQVCCNGHYSIHEFIRQLMIHGKASAVPNWRHFSSKVRSYAVMGWTDAGKPTNGNNGE